MKKLFSWPALIAVAFGVLFGAALEQAGTISKLRARNSVLEEWYQERGAVAVLNARLATGYMAECDAALRQTGVTK